MSVVLRSIKNFATAVLDMQIKSAEKVLGISIANLNDIFFAQNPSKVKETVIKHLKDNRYISMLYSPDSPYTDVRVVLEFPEPLDTYQQDGIVMGVWDKEDLVNNVSWLKCHYNEQQRHMICKYVSREPTNSYTRRLQRRKSEREAKMNVQLINR